MKIQSFKVIANLLLLGVAGAAFCGEIEFVSSVSLGTPQPVQPSSPFMATGVDNASGKSYTASLELKKIPMSSPSLTGSISSNAQWIPVARFTVKWVPTFPGETRPGTLVGKWTVVQDAEARWNYVGAPFGSGSINIQAASDPSSGNNFSETRSYPSGGMTVGPYTPAQTTMNDVSYAAFGFSDVGGDWIGVADVSIPLDASLLGSLTGGAQTTGPYSYLQTKITLTACGTFPVVN